MQTTSKPNGFTLVELAIVITIIGILIGGVLKGQQLIEQARIAGTIQQMRDYKSAVMIFQTKYDALPGDMPDADKRIIGCSNCTATVFPLYSKIHDGKVGGDNYPYATSAWNVLGTENTLFWLQLYKADMITGITDAAINGGPLEWGASHPAAKIGHGFSVVESNGIDSLRWAGNKRPYGRLLMLHENVTQDVLGRAISNSAAATIDRKMDDGQPDSGELRGTGPLGCGDESGPDAPDAEYDETTPGDKCAIGYIMSN